MKYNNILKLVVSIIICEVAGVVGSVFTVSEIKNWYVDLNKPAFNPPNWIFGPVWTTLYVLMGISLYLVWANNWTPKIKINFKGKKTLPTGRQAWNSLSEKFLAGSWQKANIILIFSVQLILNVLWSVVFFGLHSPGNAFFVLLMLWVAILFTIINFYRVSKVSAILLLPYILWVSFAGILNFTIWMIN